MPNANEAYKLLVRELREIAVLSSVGAVLEWDDRTQLPPKGGRHRSEQVSLIAKMVHERFTSPRIGDWLAEAEQSELVSDPQSDEAVNVHKQEGGTTGCAKLPTTLVEEQSRVAVLAQQAWGEARKKSDFATFEPWLTKTLDLKRQEANHVGYESEMYDALLDEFEPDETAANLRKTFEKLRAPLVELIRKIAESGRKAPLDILERDYDPAVQSKLAREAAQAVGFDFDAGYFGDAFFGVLHETGHGLYDQGLPAEHFGTPLGDAISLGIHESQSRMWENFVGRGRAFWEHFLPGLRAAFPAALAGVSDEQWYFAINDIRPSLIRTEADEATYNLHVLLRFELEQALLNDELRPKDLPEAWNQKMRQYLGLVPPDHTRGCLQDIHWSGGAIGYFPTYTLGNLYAAQFFEQAHKDIPDLDSHFARGDFAPLLDWLRTNIHRHGKRYSASDLVRRVTGKELSAEPLLRHLSRKADLYLT